MYKQLYLKNTLRASAILLGVLSITSCFDEKPVQPAEPAHGSAPMPATSQLEAKLSATQTSVTQLTTTLNSLQQQTSQLQSEKKALEAQVADLRNQLSKAKTDQDRITSLLEILSNNIDSVNTLTKKNASKILLLEDKL